MGAPSNDVPRHQHSAWLPHDQLRGYDMPHIKFTDSTLKSLSAAKTTWFTDPSCKGLRLCVTKSGVKTWYVNKWDPTSQKTRSVTFAARRMDGWSRRTDLSLLRVRTQQMRTKRPLSLLCSNALRAQSRRSPSVCDAALAARTADIRCEREINGERSHRLRDKTALSDCCRR